MTTLGRNAVAAATLHSAFDGDVLLPEDPGYDEARTVFNGAVDHRPGIIAQCTSPDDVAHAVVAARDMGLEISVRGGGHGVAGRAVTEGGLMVDLSRMNEVTVDPGARTARFGGGALMKDLDGTSEAFGLATTGGRASTTGLGGFVLGGGSGWLERKFGLACDNLLSVELVTAEGRFIEASEKRHPELFWALHGGGGNFGVATAMTLRLHELPAFTAALFLWPEENGREILGAYRDFITAAPDEVSGGFVFVTGPPEEFVPPQLQGQRCAAVAVMYAGPESAAAEVVAPLVDLEPEGKMVAQLPYSMAQTLFDDPPGMRNYWSAEYLASFPDEAADAFVDCLAGKPLLSQHVMFPGGGAVARNTDGWPVPWRGAPYVVHPFGIWEDPAEDTSAREWVRNVRATMRPWSTGDVYLNFIGDEGADRVLAGYGEENYRRLAAVKTAYDPGNLFHLNHNIKPNT